MLQADLRRLMTQTNIFTTNSRDLMTKLQESMGKNEKRCQFEVMKNPSPAISIPIHNITTNLSTNPGPGNYDPLPIQKPQTKSKAKVGGNSSRSKIFEAKKNQPGPGEYETMTTNRVSRLKSTPNIKIGKSQRRPLIEGTCLKSPPPGSYEITSKMVEGPKVTMTGKCQYDPIQKEKAKMPGAGTYEPIFIPKQRAPNVKYQETIKVIIEQDHPSDRR